MSKNFYFALILMTAIPMWPQEGAPAAAAGAQMDGLGSAQDVAIVTSTNSDAMVVPSVVSVLPGSLAFSGESARSNYVSGGLSFGGAYDDNVNLGQAGHARSDVTYSISPYIRLDVTRSRLTWDFAYSPGFTFYRRISSLNQADHRVNLGLTYRLSPHVSLTLSEGFDKSSNVLNQYGQNGQGGISEPSYTILAPVSERISDTSGAQLSYQFAANTLVGVTGNFTALWYPNRNQSGGLSDSKTRSGSAFYTHRLSGRHYVGVTYRYEFLTTSPQQAQTSTHSALFFYTLYLQPRLSLSLFAGPEYSASSLPFGTPATLLHSSSWSPSAGAGLAWQGRRTSMAANYSRRVSDGGGLSTAVRSNSADVSFRQQMSRHWNGSASAVYVRTQALGPVRVGSSDGHTLSGTASLQRALGEHMTVQAGYTRLHQSYSGLGSISTTPDVNREWGSLSYNFNRPLGR